MTEPNLLRAYARGLYHACGVHHVDERPLVGIACSWNELVPGHGSNYHDGRVANHVYFAALLEPAVWGAELAVALRAGASRGRIYVVEPTGPFEDDPNVTNKRFPGNVTRSYRTRHPMRVIAEQQHWEGHPPDVLQGMLDNLARLRAEGRDLEPIVEDMAELGIGIWQGTLPQNDIVKLQKQLKGRMVLMGGIDAAIVDRADATEEEIRTETRRVLETYCPNGNFIPCITYGGPGTIYPQGDQFINDEIDRYNREVYGIQA